MSDTSYLGDPGTPIAGGAVNQDTTTINSSGILPPGGCYPSDFIGPLPPGANYCNTPNTPTFFGAINSMLQQGAKTAAQIRQTLNQYQGGTIKPVVVTVAPSSNYSTIGLLILAVGIGLVVWLVIRERR
jgi:hypothetical protein